MLKDINGKAAYRVLKNDNTGRSNVHAFLWRVKTAAGNWIDLYESTPIQPERGNWYENIKDVSSNCHGFSFNLRNVLCPDGQRRTYSLVQDQDVQTLLRDSYQEVQSDAIFDPANQTNGYVMIVMQKNKQSGKLEAVHSCRWDRGAIGWTGSTGQMALFPAKTLVNTKNNWDNIQNDVRLSEVLTVFPPDEPVKVYKLKTS